MKRALLLLLPLVFISSLFLSCGYSAPSSSSNTSGIKSRAFISQDVTGGNVFAGVEVINTKTDQLFGGTLIAAGNTPGMMVVTPNRNQTLVFSSSDRTLNIINNAIEQNAVHATLPATTQSIVVTPDSSTAFVAMPTAPVSGQPATGAIDVISLSNAAVTAQLSCIAPQNPPGPCFPQVHSYQFLSISHSGNRILAFSNSADTTDPPCAPPNLPCYAFVITPTNIGTQTNPVVPISGFDHPVMAFFTSDDTTAYVVSCGANCGGTTASVQKLDMTANPPVPGVSVDVPAAETATVVGTTMFFAGTPVPASPCTGQKTQAQSCGLVTVFDLNKFVVTNSSPIIVTDGYHDHIAMGSNGQLFVGAHDCTEITGSETRGCLAIYNTNTGAIVVPPAPGDVTGLQPIANRNIVYLVQGGELAIYDTTTDKLWKTQIDISGEAVDVVAVDQ